LSGEGERCGVDKQILSNNVCVTILMTLNLVLREWREFSTPAPLPLLESSLRKEKGKGSMDFSFFFITSSPLALSHIYSQQ